MGLYNEQQTSPWLIGRLGKADMSVLADLARLGIAHKKMKSEELEKYKPDLSMYGVDKIEGMAGDKSLVASQSNKALGKFNKLVNSYGGDYQKTILSDEYNNDVLPSLTKVLYNSTVAKENLIKYQSAKAIAPEELQEIYLDSNGDPLPQLNAKGKVKFLTKEEYLNLEFQRASDIPRYGMPAKLDGDGVLKSVDFNISRGNIKQFRDETKSIFTSTGSSDLTGVNWQDVSNLDPGASSSLGALLEYAPYSNTNAPQISNAVNSFTEGGLSPEARHGLRQSYWQDVQQRFNDEDKSNDYKQTFDEFTQRQVKLEARNYINEKVNLGTPKKSDGSEDEGTNMGIWTDSADGLLPGSNMSIGTVDLQDSKGRYYNQELPTFEYTLPTLEERVLASPKGVTVDQLSPVVYIQGMPNTAATAPLGSAFVDDYVKTIRLPSVYDPELKGWRIAKSETETMDILNNKTDYMTHGYHDWDIINLWVHEEDAEGFNYLDYRDQDGIADGEKKGLNKGAVTPVGGSEFAWIGEDLSGGMKSAKELDKSNAKVYFESIGKPYHDPGGLGKDWIRMQGMIPRNDNMVYKDDATARKAFNARRSETDKVAEYYTREMFTKKTDIRAILSAEVK